MKLATPDAWELSEQTTCLTQDQIDDLEKKAREKIGAIHWNVIVRPYVPPQKKGGLIMLDSVQKREGLHNVFAKVISIGRDAFYDKEMKVKLTPRYAIGNWVVIPRGEGLRMEYKGLPLRIINDDAVLAVVHSEEDVRDFTLQAPGYVS